MLTTGSLVGLAVTVPGGGGGVGQGQAASKLISSGLKAVLTVKTRATMCYWGDDVVDEHGHYSLGMFSHFKTYKLKHVLPIFVVIHLELGALAG